MLKNFFTALFAPLFALSALLFSTLAHAHGGSALPMLSEAAIRNSISTMKIMAPLPIKPGREEGNAQGAAKRWVMFKVRKVVPERASLYFGKNLARGDGSGCKLAGLAIDF